MATIDPRLADATILVLAAKRCQARQQAPDWRQAEGISALLEVARRLPRREPGEDLDGGGSMARLLEQARQWQKEHADGA